jgi:hypothetical protein
MVVVCFLLAPVGIRWGYFHMSVVFPLESEVAQRPKRRANFRIGCMARALSDPSRMTHFLGPIQIVKEPVVVDAGRETAGDTTPLAPEICHRGH